MSQKPTIILYGNCNATALRDALRRVPAIEAQYEVHWIRSFTLPFDEKDNPIDLSAMPRCAIFFEQAGSFREDFDRRKSDFKEVPMPPGCRRFRFPPLFMNTLWPFVVNDPRNTATRVRWHTEGAYPVSLGNRLICEIMSEERDPDRIYDRFMSIRIRDKVDLDRLHALTIEKVRALDRDSDITYGDFIENRFTTERLFLAILHPDGPAVRRLFEQAFHLLDIPAEVTAELLAETEKGRGIGEYDAPIHPEIVEHFGLTWARNLRYRHFDEGSFPYAEFIRRYIHFAFTPEYYEGMFHARNGRPAQALPLLEKATRREDAPARYFEEYGRVCALLSKPNAAASALSRAAALRRAAQVTSM